MNLTSDPRATFGEFAWTEFEMVLEEGLALASAGKLRQGYPQGCQFGAIRIDPKMRAFLRVLLRHCFRRYRS
jgi:hypothetical protein